MLNKRFKKTLPPFECLRMKHISSFRYLSYCVLSFILIGCVEEYPFKDKSSFNVVVVEGTLTDLSEPQVIKLSRSKTDPSTGMSFSEAISGAQVELVVDATQFVPFVEGIQGTYKLTSSFQAQIGHNYQLRFRLSDNTRYESSPETMQAVPPLLNIRQQFNANSLTLEQLNGYTSANDILVDFEDPANIENYYQWDWTLWERQFHCFAGAFYDLYCNRECWEIIRNPIINVSNDKFSNGKAVTNKRLAQIPYYQDRACLVEVRQSSLSKQAFQFLKLTEEQAQTTGTLVDTPPATLVGNIHNVANNQEAVVGYFKVSSVSKVLFWLDRSNNTGTSIGLYRGLYGRTPNVSPFNESPCILSDTRTPFKPEGWRQ